MLFVQLSSILFVGAFVTAPLLVLRGYFVTPLYWRKRLFCYAPVVQDLLRSYVVLPHPYAMYCL